MATVAFVVHPDRPAAAEMAAGAGRWLEERGHRVLHLRDDTVERSGHPAAAVAEVDGASAELAGADLAVSLGGDGTMLRTVALAAVRDVPVLGVNLGRLGYLTEVEPAGLEVALEGFLAGAHHIQERMMLEVVVRRAAASTTFVALNEAVLEKTVPGHTVRITAAIAGHTFMTYAADGLLVATATGSTAYNLSARGPIVSPQLRALVVTPISPHMLFDRPLVLDPGEDVELTVAEPRPGVVVVDGLDAGIVHPGDAVTCRAAGRCARLVTFGERNFHGILKARFHLADR